MNPNRRNMKPYGDRSSSSNNQSLQGGFLSKDQDIKSFFQGLLDDDLLVDDEEDDFDIGHEDNSFLTSISQDILEFSKGAKFALMKSIRFNRKLQRLIIGTFVGLLLLVYFWYYDYDYKEITLNFDSVYTKHNTETHALDKIAIPNIEEMYPDEKSVDIFDPRLAPAALLLYIENIIKSKDMTLSEEFSIPFSWGDWINLESKLDYDYSFLSDWLAVHSEGFQKNLNDLVSLDCQTFALLYGCEGNKDFFSNCVDIEPQSDYPFRFQITGPTTAKIKEPGRLLYAASYMKLSQPAPSKIFLLNVFGSNGEGSLIVNIKQDESISNGEILRDKNILKYLLDIEIKENPSFLSESMTVSDIRHKFSQFLKKAKIGKMISNKEHRTIDYDQTYLVVNGKEAMELDHWKVKDFIWDEGKFLNELQNKALSVKESNYDTELSERLETLEKFRLRTGFHPKYLSEAHLYNTGLGSHFDWRFFSGSYILNDSRQSIIHRLARTWLRFCFENDLKTFIAYGSMLGWIRNGLTLPWDGDIDVIVTMESLNLLARNFNQTLIIDYSEKDQFQSAMTGYLIDINPAYYSRIKGDGNNVIDGRLIDISTGIYLDITALAWTDNYLKDAKSKQVLKKVVDPNYDINQHFALEGEVYGKQLMEEIQQLQNDKQLVHCKNDNVYKIAELSTMVPSYFEGARAYFPHSYETIIRRLYPKALDRDTEPDHIFDRKFNLWVNIYDCPEYANEEGVFAVNAPFGTCNSTVVQREYRLTRNYTSQHQQMISGKEWESYSLGEETESKPFRIDEFFIEYSMALGLTPDELEELYI